MIDTNVFVSSFVGGKPRAVIDLWIERKLTLCLSPEILDEYLRVFESLDVVDNEEYPEIIGLLEEQFNLVFTDSTQDLNVVESDPSDDKFLECGIELNADTVISGDRDLIELGTYGRLDLRTPDDFLRSFRQSGE